MNRHQERSIRVGNRVVHSQVGFETGENVCVERDVIGGWPKDAASDALYSITINPESPRSEAISYALHQALNISGPDVDELLEGRVAVLMEFDLTTYYVLLGFLRALGLFYSVGTRS
jgi:hypothetical protein